MNENIGITAGEIFSYLQRAKSKVDVLRLKLDLKKDNSIIFMALGWLSREGKITVSKEQNSYFVSLTL